MRAWDDVCARVCVFTFTGLRVRLEDESFGAGAGVGARRVPAQAVVAEQAVHQALVDVWAETREGLGKNSDKIGRVLIWLKFKLASKRMSHVYLFAYVLQAHLFRHECNQN